MRKVMTARGKDWPRLAGRNVVAYGALALGAIASRGPSLQLALAVIGGLAALLAMQQATKTPVPLASAAASVAQARDEPAAVHTCRADLGWARPSEAEIGRTVWLDNRYSEPDGSIPWHMRAYYERHFVLFTTPTGSGTSHALDLTGLITAGSFGPELCGSGPDPALLDGREVAVWALGYRVVGAAVGGERLAVRVVANQPTTRGYHIVQAPRPAASTWSASFSLADATEVARWSTTDGEVTARSATEPCTGVVVGRVVADYGARRPAVGESIKLTGVDPHRPDALVRTNTRTGPDGSFRVESVPVGQHDGAARHARFHFNLERCGQTLDVGIVPYPLVHPDPAGMQAFDRFMQERLDRQDRQVLDLLTDELRTHLGGITPVLTQGSNPCWYRFQVMHVDQPTPETLVVRVRVYMHHWSGDNAGSLPQSREQVLGFVHTPFGWRVERIGDWENARDEPAELHGWTTSACSVIRHMPAVKGAAPSWSAPLPERSASSRAHALEVVRAFSRSVGVRQDAGDVEYVGRQRVYTQLVELYAQAASRFHLDPTTDTVVDFARASVAGQPAASGRVLDEAVLQERARAFVSGADPRVDLPSLTPVASVKGPPSGTVHAFRWEDAQHSLPARCPGDADKTCVAPAKLVFVQVALDSAGNVLSYTNTLRSAR